MPYKSDAQRRFFHSPGAKAAGISEADVAKFDAASKGKALPERVKAKRDHMKKAMRKAHKQWQDQEDNPENKTRM